MGRALSWGVSVPLVIVAIAWQVWGDMELPKPIRAIIPAYPNTAVVTALEMKEGTSAVMEGKGEPREVVAFYKKHLEAKGWEVQMEMSQKTTQGIIFRKGEQNLTIMVESPSKGQITIAVTLSK